MTSAALIERICIYVCVQCDRTGCTETFIPEVTSIGNENPTDPVDAWAIRIAKDAERQGWSTSQSNTIFCPRHTNEALARPE